MLGLFKSNGAAAKPQRPVGIPAGAKAASRPRHWSQAARENPLARFVPFSSLVSDHDVITRGGDYLRVWRLDGVPFECADEHLIAERHEALCSLLRNLAGGQWAVWTHRLHRVVSDSLQHPPQPGFARDLSIAYQAKLGERRMMSNELYLTLVYRPNTSRMSRALQSKQRSIANIAAAQAEALRVMEERSALVMRVLRGFGPQLMGVRQSSDGRVRQYSEVAEFLGYLVNGCWRAIPKAAGPLHRTLPTTRLSFGGDKLELRQGDTRRYAALVDIKEYADAVEPGILNALLFEGSEFIETQSFSILPRRDAMRALELQRDQLIASDDVVATQVAEMDVALNELGDGQFCMGEYHYSLVVFGDDGADGVKDAGRRAAQAIGAVGEACSLQMAPVDLVADAAWFAQLPGNWQWRPRDAKLSSRAFAALASGHNFARGKRDGNPWGEALALLRTPSGQPFYLNLHSSPDGEDSTEKKLPGNTLIIGSTGVGKTTLEMFLLTLTRKWYPAPRLVLFDLDRGCEIAIRALGGRYFTLEAGKPTGCNPLQREPTPARMQFWEQLIRTCIDSPALPLLPSDERAIADAVKAVSMMPAKLRRFSTIRQNLPKSGENSLFERLGRWCQGGALGWVFDQADDRLLDLNEANVIGFDTTEFLDLPEVRTPVMMYLLQVMEELVNGERLIYVISEFWKALDHPIFSDFAKQKQKTIRKQNGLGIFDTQSPSDVLRHPIGRTMIEQSVTKIFLANPEAVRDEYVEGFGLSEAEFEIVKSLSAQGGRRFLVKQGHASAICEMDLAGLEDFVTVLSATTDNIALLDSIRARVGDDPFQWLPVLIQEVQDRKSRNSRSVK
jgi:type IV secretion system protein VirB4